LLNKGDTTEKTDRNFYINGRRKEDGVKTDRLSERWIVLSKYYHVPFDGGSKEAFSSAYEIK
jgi:hypothetical protein